MIRSPLGFRAPTSRRLLLALWVGVLTLTACHGRTRFDLDAKPETPPVRTAAAAPLKPDLANVDPALLGPRRAEPTHRLPVARPVAGPPSPAPRRGGKVFLSDRDLAAVDAFINVRNKQWILGDDVEVIASREYFAQNLTVNATLGMVRRTDTTRVDQTTVELVYIGPRGTASITTSPRIMIGTGLTITARHRLVLRLVRSTAAGVPLSLRITARGEASRGRKDEIFIRRPTLQLGGEIRRQGNRWVWYPIG